MTLNHAKAIMDFIVECKVKKKMSNEEVVWELANNFNIEEDNGQDKQTSQ